MTLRDALRALDASMIFLTVASIALSVALMKTGGAQYVAEGLRRGELRSCRRCGS